MSSNVQHYQIQHPIRSNGDWRQRLTLLLFLFLWGSSTFVVSVRAVDAEPTSNDSSAPADLEPTTLPPSTESGTNTPSTPASRFRELLLWEKELAQGAYAMEQTPERFSRILTAYEQLIYQACMPQIHRTLLYQGSPSDPDCNEYLATTFTLDPKNAAATCAKEGIDAAPCTTAWLDILQRTFSRGPTATSSGLDQALSSSRTAAESQTLFQELRLLEQRFARTYHENLSPEESAAQQTARFELQPVLRRLVIIECKQKEYMVEKGVDDSTIPIRGATSTPVPLNLDTLQKPAFSLGVDRKKPAEVETSLLDREIKPLPYPIRRVRLVSERCKEVINRGKKLEPAFPSIVCADIGDYSPQCIQALREWKRIQPRKSEHAEDPSVPAGALEKKKELFDTF